jgi:hypothetical protein
MIDYSKLLGLPGTIWSSLQLFQKVRQKWTAPRATTAFITSPLEIIFEPLNPNRYYWSIETSIDDYGRIIKTVWEHRVLIRNESGSTLKNVSVKIERGGAIPDKPRRGLFIRTKKDSCDLQPRCEELVAVIESPISKKTPIGGLSGFAYGPIKITASADGVPPVERWFDFDWQAEQGLFSRE